MSRLVSSQSKMIEINFFILFYFIRDFVRELTPEEKMDRFGVSSAKKNVFPKTEAEYAAAAEYAEKLHEDVLLGEEKVNKELEMSEANEEDEDDGRIVIM